MAGDSDTPVWRALFDAVAGPVTHASETWVQTNSFMDALSLAWRVQQRADREVRRGLEMWFGALSLPTRGDMDRLSAEVARVERELRELRRELERSSSAPRSPGRPRGRTRQTEPKRR